MRQDENNDAEFYRLPRRVTHIDENAIRVLERYYDAVLPKEGSILDFCSSWVSHYPTSVEDVVRTRPLKLKVLGMGMNADELWENPLLTGARIVADLNVRPDAFERDLPFSPIDAATCAVSIEYLTKPREALENLRRTTCQHRLDGIFTRCRVHLVISNRCFPTKAVRRWLEVSDDERLQMVGDYLHFSGWHNITIVELCNRNGDTASRARASSSSGAQVPEHVPTRSAGYDSLWVVRGYDRQLEV